MKDIQEELSSIGIVKEVRIESKSALDFEFDAGAIIITFFLDTFGKALIGKMANSTWDLIAKLFKRKSDFEGKIVVSYCSKIRRSKIEILVEYDNLKQLRNDSENHRLYISAGLGYALAKIPPVGKSVSLLSIIDENVKPKPYRLVVQRASTSPLA